MITVKCTYANGDTVMTRINCTLREAEQYFLGRVFNLGSVGDNMQKCTKVEEVTE
jgi:hypothetical protein